MSTPAGPGGAQKVAAFLASLDRQSAAAVMKKLDARIVPEVVAAMADLDASFASPAKVDELYLDLARALHRKAGASSRGEPELVQMLESALGVERAKGVLAEIRDRQRQERPFAFLESQPPAMVARALSDESPAVVALVLAHVPPALSGAVLGQFDAEERLGIVRRMASLVPPGYLVLGRTADVLERRLEAALREPLPQDPALRPKSIAEMLKVAEPDVQRTVLEDLEEENKAVVAEIREYMFTWADLGTVDKRSMQKILSSIDTRTLAVALKGCDAAIESNVLENLSARVKKMVADERELAGALPMAEVQMARGQLLKAVRALIESGDLRSAGGEELVS